MKLHIPREVQNCTYDEPPSHLLTLNEIGHIVVQNMIKKTIRIISDNNMIII